jgi:N-acetylglucosamine kinase-like BadF-type ATPase
LYYLGVDGGGTKTAFVLLDKQLNVMATHETSTCYYIEVGMDGAKELLENGVRTLLEKANLSLSDIAFGFFGLPAYGEDSSLLAQMDALPSSLLPATKYQCGNDMVNGWAAAFGCLDGINIVAGTGSIAYGVKGDKYARCGGWGEIFSDEGSAYWIGCKGLQAFTRMSDGRSEIGILYDLFKSHFALKYDLDITGIVLNQWQADRSKVATVSRLVFDAALAGDRDALAIFESAAEELAVMIDSVKRSLGYTEHDVINVSYSGGVFNAGDVIMLPLFKALSRYSSQYTLHTPQHSPAIGAALFAAKISNRAIRAS